MISRGGTENDPCFVQPLIDISKKRPIQIGIMGKPAGCAQRHADHIRAQNVGILQRGKVYVRGGFGGTVFKYFQNGQLRARGSPGKLLRSLRGIACRNGCNMGAVTMDIGYIVVHISVVIGKGHLFGHISSRN